MEVVKVRMQNTFANPSAATAMATSAASTTSFDLLPALFPSSCHSTATTTTTTTALLERYHQFATSYHHHHAAPYIPETTLCSGSSATANLLVAAPERAATLQAARFSAPRVAPPLSLQSSNELSQTIAMIRHIAQYEGTSGFYKGLRPSLAMIVPNATVYYTIYDCLADYFRAQLANHGSSNTGGNTPTSSAVNSWIIPLVGGSTARLIASTVTAPLEYLRTVQAANLVVGGYNHSGQGDVLARSGASAGAAHSSGGGIWKPLAHLWRHQGARSLFRGLEPLLWRDLPFSAIYWLSVEKLREVQQERQQQQQTTSSSWMNPPQVVWDFGQGAIAATLAALGTAPADVVKTRFQAHMAQTAALTAASKTTTRTTNVTPLTILQDILSQPAGWKQLWKGNLARTLKLAPSCAIMLATYEWGKRTLMASS